MFRITGLLALLMIAVGCDEGTRSERSTGKAPKPAGVRAVLASDGTIEVAGFDGPTIRRLENEPPDEATWQRLLAVRVGDDESLPAVLGTMSFETGRVRFRPRFPLQAGLEYSVTWDPSVLAGDERRVVRETILVPSEEREPMTVVEAIHPSTADVPENLLRVYLHFSAPMSRGRAYEHLRLLDADGRPIPDPFLELTEELWDTEGRRFTLLFDPGRVKRGLVPNAELGRALVDGETYTMVVSSEWQDAEGTPLAKDFRHTFKVGPEDTAGADPTKWTIARPSDSRVLRVTYDDTLDEAMLVRFVTVVGPDGKAVPGEVTVVGAEREWRFRPTAPWVPGEYALVVDPRLEDVAGNGIARPFEVPIDDPDDGDARTADPVRVPFRITPATIEANPRS